MKAVELKPGVYWVGYIDWSLREFHGYSTPRGTTYNAYLIVDEQVTLVDTVKEYGLWELVERIASVVDPEDIDNIVVNHVEMDHSGSVPLLMDLVPDATIITSARGKQFLEQHYGEEWDYRLVSTGDEVSIGENTLTFVQMPMVHWPDSMATYVEQKKLLLPNDAFGQHIASAERFDDQLGWAVIHEEAAKYYANIVMPFGGPVQKALEAVSDLDFDMVGPSHGVVWRSHLPDIIEAYKRWSSNETEDRAVVAYDTMWGSTELLARELVAGLEEAGVPTVLRSLHSSEKSDIMTEVLNSKAVLVGSPTFNNQLLPSVAALLTYMKALKPKKRVGLAFGSYGWSGEGARKVQEAMEELGWETPLETINVKFVPGDEELESAHEAGHALGCMLVGEEQESPMQGTGGGEMNKYQCSVCGYIYDPEEGDPDNGVDPGTPFEELPEDWVCPVCGAQKSEFEKLE